MTYQRSAHIIPTQVTYQRSAHIIPTQVTYQRSAYVIPTEVGIAAGATTSVIPTEVGISVDTVPTAVPTCVGTTNSGKEVPTCVGTTSSGKEVPTCVGTTSAANEVPTFVGTTGVHQYRTIWLSDIHLGTPGCRADYLLDFLRVHSAQTLYLVGDILDGWRLSKGWYWPQTHNDVVQKILRAARKGTRVIYVPGNHDSLSRQFIGLSFGGIQVVEDAIHVTARGTRLWITHGDLFDAVMQHATWLAHLGSWLYEWLLDLNRWTNAVRLKLGMPYWSISQYLKHKAKDAVSFISQFENVMAAEAKRRGCDGVVCGHIHKAEIRDIDGVLYCNDGDWVESMTALVETFEGELRIVHWSTRQAVPLNLGRIADEPAEETQNAAA